MLQKLRHPHIAADLSNSSCPCWQSMCMETVVSLTCMRAQVEFLGAFVDNSRDSSGGTLCLLMAFCEGSCAPHHGQFYLDADTTP